MLVELGLVEQRIRRFVRLNNGALVTDVARRRGVSRQAVHERRLSNQRVLRETRLQHYGGLLSR